MAPKNQPKTTVSAAPAKSARGRSSLTTLVVLTSVVVGLLSAVIHLAPTHVFDPVKLQEIAQAAIKKHNTSQGIVDEVIAQVRKTYPKHTLEGNEWMFNNAGNAMGSMIVLHASFSEYVIIFGTAVGTEGHTGRFLADDWFTILYGEQWAFEAGELEKEVYKPGDQHHLKWGSTKQYRMPDTCWALEYARGNIPSMLPFGLADTMFSTLDFVTFYQTTKVSAYSMMRELFQGKV